MALLGILEVYKRNVAVRCTGRISCKVVHITVCKVTFYVCSHNCEKYYQLHHVRPSICPH
jgi:hypothetical protein